MWTDYSVRLAKRTLHLRWLLGMTHLCARLNLDHDILTLKWGEFFIRMHFQAYIDRFDFHGDPLDVALRKLLMDVGFYRGKHNKLTVSWNHLQRDICMCNRNLFDFRWYVWVIPP